MSGPSFIVLAMSEATMRALQEALTAAARLRQEAEQQKNECLAQIAEALPGKADGLAKRIATAEPEVTKSLGKEGIGQFRTELAHEAAVLAKDIRGAVAEINWPMPKSTFDKVDTRKIHSAIFGYMYGQRVNKLADVFKRHGYSIHDNAQHSQGIVAPQNLYEEEKFGSVAAALNALGEAERKVTKARTADDNSTVDDIWGD
jgi:hypothetical protein